MGCGGDALCRLWVRSRQSPPPPPPPPPFAAARWGRGNAHIPCRVRPPHIQHVPCRVRPPHIQHEQRSAEQGACHALALAGGGVGVAPGACVSTSASARQGAAACVGQALVYCWWRRAQIHRAPIPDRAVKDGGPARSGGCLPWAVCNRSHSLHCPIPSHARKGRLYPRIRARLRAAAGTRTKCRTTGTAVCKVQPAAPLGTARASRVYRRLPE
jgi:hypothetical protein